MKPRLFVLFLLAALVLPPPARGQITVPGQITSALPTELEGFRLGEPLEKIRMMFHEGRLVGLRLDYRKADPERARKLAATCDGHDPLHGSSRRRECIDAERRVAWSVDESRRAELLDVAKMLAAGLLTQAKLERALRGRTGKREVVGPAAVMKPAP
jgi:hypothetical protein